MSVCEISKQEFYFMKQDPLFPFLLYLFLLSGLPLITCGQTSDKAQLQQFENAITKGEEYLAAKDYAKAKVEYQKALSINPDAKYPKDKLAQIRKVYIDPADEAKFKQAFEKGDRFLAENNYLSAKEQYGIALQIKPEDRIAREKMLQVEKLAEEKNVKDKEYQSQVEIADNLFLAKDYTAARKQYELVEKLNPDQKYPKTRISEIDALLASQKSVNDSYDKAITDADEAYMSKDFSLAQIKYEQASRIKPDENYPKSMLERVKESMGTQLKNKATYNDVINQADGLFNKKDYQAALISYQNALLLMSDEKYPTEQINKINKMLQSAQELEDNYNKAISLGDQLYNEGKLSEAITAYRQAKNLKPDESYPEAKINDISNQILTEQSKADAAYDEAVKSADFFIKADEFDKAIEQYNVALTIKSNEEYPKEGIRKANELKNAKAKTENDFESLLSDADKYYKAESFDDALTDYIKAGNLKPDNQYIKDQISAINKIQELNKDKADQYARLVKEADELYARQELSNALNVYQLAEKQKPNDEYITSQINKINEQLMVLGNLESAYEGYIKNADQYFENNNLDLSGTEYQKALGLKPDEAYPKQRLAEIASKIESSKALEEENTRLISEADKSYQDAIEKANQFYTEQDYPSAIVWYEKASEIKPQESSPKDRLIQINNLLLERMKNNLESYNKFIQAGDLAFQSQVFDQALEEFNKAATARPDEAYPPLMISKINKLMEDNAIIDLISTPIVLLDTTEQKYNFKAIDMRLRKNNYILIKAKKTSEKAPKVFINYGKDGLKSGGLVLKGMESDEVVDYLLRISIQDMWYRNDNNWISLYSEGGDLEITLMQISQGDIQPAR